jgi:FolB domain-containing protein
MDQIFIKELLVRGVIGVGEDERKQPQDIIISITLFTDTSICGQTDSINDTANYRTIAKRVYAHTERIARYTVEALAADIAAICLEVPQVDSVRVRVEKPGAVRFSQSVGVEIERSRSS